MADIETSTSLRSDDSRSAMTICGAGDGVCEILRDIPSHVVKDLLSVGVCEGCILRLFGIRRDLYLSSTLPTSVLNSVFGDLVDLEKQSINAASEENVYCSNCSTLKEPEVSMVFCSLCFGILQFAYRDQKGVVVHNDSAYDFAASIAELVKQDGHQVDGFSLEVSIPQVIQENELSICLYMKKIYGSEPWLQKRLLSECVSVKDALKISIAKPLEKMLDCKSTGNTFRIRVTYNHPKALSAVQNSIERNQGCKRRKAVVGTGNGLENNDGAGKSADFPIREVSVVVKSSLETHQGSQLSDGLEFLPEKVTEPCQLVFQCNRSNIYFGGRYLKFSRNVSQTRWIIDDERMGDASVEELIGSKIFPVCRGDNYKFHAAGREDIDVRMLGSGRPFLVEIQNARRVPSEDDVKDIEKRINDAENKLVGVKNLKIVGSQGWTLMREGEAEKQKQYAALVWISRPLKDEDFQSINSYKEMHVLQKTPIRVLHRRSPLEREKIIYWMRIEKVVGSSQYFLLHLCTQAGTYIKEFVHGDLGRTHPSIGSILDCRAEILQLDVTDVKMDCFLDEQGIL